MMSAPARSTASTSAARREKSAERIEGAMRTDSAIRYTSLPDSPFARKTEHDRKGSEPHQARLVTIMRARQCPANDRVADQCRKHKYRQRDIGDLPCANGPDDQGDRSGEREKTDGCFEWFDHPESYCALLLARREIGRQLVRNEMREHRLQHPFLRLESLAC